MVEFRLHQRLDADTFVITDLKLCRVLLMNDKRYVWVVLVPRIDGLRDIHNLSYNDQHRLMDEINQIAEAMEREFNADKMNVAALGNRVPQLHIHIIARNIKDDAWPDPVWGVGDAVFYDEEEAQTQCQRIKSLLED